MKRFSNKDWILATLTALGIFLGVYVTLIIMLAF